MGTPLRVSAAEPAGREAGAGEREQHASGDVELAVHGGKRGDEDDEVDDTGGAADVACAPSP